MFFSISLCLFIVKKVKVKICDSLYLADVVWDYKHYCWKSCIRNRCNWKVHPDLKNVPPWSFTIHVTVYFKNSKFQNQAIRGFWENWLLKTFSPVLRVYLVYKSGLRFEEVPKLKVRKRPLPLSLVAFSSFVMEWFSIPKSICAVWMSRTTPPPPKWSF